MPAVSASGALANPMNRKPNAASPRYQTLDHWRGLACLIVVIHHAILPMCDHERPVRINSAAHTITRGAIEKSVVNPPIQRLAKRPRLLNRISDQLHIGVEMFFVISGYCITASAESFRRSGRTNREYFLRRFMRIYPSFWCALIGSVMTCFVIDFLSRDLLKQSPWPLAMPWDLSFLQWIGSITLTASWIGCLTGESKMYFPIQEWTLCYETQFYVVVGILLALSRRRFFQAAAVLTAVVAAVDVLVLCYPIPIKGFFFDEHWFMFAAGVGLYWDLHCATANQATIFRMMALSVLVGLTILASATTIFGNGSQFSAWRVVEALGFAGLLLFLKKSDERIASLPYLNGLKSCGVICYSIYLTHLFPTKFLSQQITFLGYNDIWSIVFLRVPLTLAMSVVLGYVFHAFVERRFLAGCYDLARKRPSPNALKSTDTSCETLEFNQFHGAASSNPPFKKAA